MLLLQAIKFPLTSTFSEVLEKFIQKANLDVLPRWYRLYLDVAGCEEEMENDSTLDSFPLPTPVTILILHLTVDHPSQFLVF